MLGGKSKSTWLMKECQWINDEHDGYHSQLYSSYFESVSDLVSL